MDLVHKQGEAAQPWQKYVAVLSGTYIYFYSIEDMSLIEEVVLFFKGQTSNLVGSKSGDDATLKSIKKKVPKHFNQLHYEQYFLIKGCDNIEKVEDL